MATSVAPWPQKRLESSLQSAWRLALCRPQALRSAAPGTPGRLTADAVLALVIAAAPACPAVLGAVLVVIFRVFPCVIRMLAHGPFSIPTHGVLLGG